MLNDSLEGLFLLFGPKFYICVAVVGAAAAVNQAANPRPHAKFRNNNFKCCFDTTILSSYSIGLQLLMCSRIILP